MRKLAQKSIKNDSKPDIPKAGLTEPLDKRAEKRQYLDGKDSLKHWNNLEPELRKIIEENNGDLPGWNKLKEDHCDVTNAIYKYHGKFPAVREKLRELGILKDRISEAEIREHLAKAIDAYMGEG